MRAVGLLHLFYCSPLAASLILGFLGANLLLLGPWGQAIQRCQAVLGTHERVAVGFHHGHRPHG